MDAIQAMTCRMESAYQARISHQVQQMEEEIESFLLSGAMMRDITLAIAPPTMKMSGLDMIPVKNWRIR